MKVLKNLPTNAVRYGEISDPGDIFLPELVSQMQERYSFWEVPNSQSEFDLKTGANFRFGRYKKVLISKLTLYTNGILVEGETNTDFLDSFVDDFLDWLQAKFRCKYNMQHPVSRTYRSGLEVQASNEFRMNFEKFSNFANSLTSSIEAYGIDNTDFSCTSMVFSADSTRTGPIIPGRFAFERRVGKAFTENVYYSEAPVSTSEHIDLLAKFESVFLN